eukprot:scaffold531_cov92-Isochrysis_galbana.AAC.3
MKNRRRARHCRKAVEGEAPGATPSGSSTSESHGKTCGGGGRMAGGMGVQIGLWSNGCVRRDGPPHPSIEPAQHPSQHPGLEVAGALAAESVAQGLVQSA